MGKGVRVSVSMVGDGVADGVWVRVMLVNEGVWVKLCG